MNSVGSEHPERRPLLATPLHVATSSPWLYPFKGMYFFMGHSFLWPVLRARLLPCFILSLIVYTFLFLVAYLPQVAFFAIFYGRSLAWVNAAFLVLGEGAAIVAILFEAFFVDEGLADIFDAVLIHEGLDDLVAQGRDLVPDGADPVKKLGKSRISHVYSPFSFRQICEFVILLPLTFAPVVGTPIFLVLTGYRAGPLQHWRYFKLLGLTEKDKKQAIKRRQRKYTWFGTVHLALQLIPGLSMLFLLTTSVGSAMWAAKLEKKRRLAAVIVQDIALGLSTV
ncbi:uncharacterized protein B0H18DRAFT_881472 [Fomitopsis serialis]|uniref:uncharacterized protein n=1 Tax=Fomitopsis serialis TaxID=139415 RepID=UPI00200882E0|nr:uncharacterized protein B0H18DRAFT_881472 [Neoantrodia serialis]KAH9919927.1 hypothetical protein B0H18DRAFT_881472 [Neoantrodia serialis]